MSLTIAKGYRHKKSGGLYQILEEVKSKIEGISDTIIVYQSVLSYDRYARTRSDFESSFEETNHLLVG